MSDADVRLVEGWIEESPTAAADWIAFWDAHAWANDIDHRAIEGAPDDVGLIVGREALRAYYAEWDEMFDGLEVRATGITDAGDGKVVVGWHVVGTAKASGVSAELDLFVAYWLREGKVVRSREYTTREEAEAAARAAL